MSTKIYSSSYQRIPLVQDSPFTYLFRTRFNEYSPDAPAYIDAASGFTITRAQTRDMSMSFAYGLRHTLAKMGGVPLTRGDVVMLLSPNSIAWPVVLFGGWAAGLRMTLANSSYTPREAAYQWQDSKAKVIVVHPNLLPSVLEMFKLLDIDLTEAQRRIIVADWGAIPLSVQGYICMSDLLGKGTLQQEESFSGELAQDTALLCYSSGTTGKPKGVEVSVRYTSHLLYILIRATCLRPPTKTLRRSLVSPPESGRKAEPPPRGRSEFCHIITFMVLLPARNCVRALLTS